MERIHVKVPGEQLQDREYMKQALALAEKGHGWVNPNPMVGAVLVKDGRIIGEGYHTRYGQLHAERNAIANAKKRGNSLEGSTIYVTLEPCCHYGKTPPCTEAIIEEKIASGFICDTGTLLPHRKTAAVHGSGAGIRGEARDCRLHGSESGGGRARHPASEGKRAGSGGRSFARRV